MEKKIFKYIALEQEFYKGKYDYLDESTTGNGLEYGYDNEEITNIEEVSKEEA